MTEPGASSATIALGQQHRRLAAGDQRGADHDVGPLQLSVILLALPALVVLAHLPGVAAGGLGRACSRLVDGDEARAEALDLLLRGGAHVGRRDDGAEPARRGDRLQPGHPGAHHQHARRLDRAGGGHHHRKGAAELGGGIEHRLVAGEVGLRGQDVHRLGAGDARQQLHREGGRSRRGHRLRHRSGAGPAAATRSGPRRA